VAIQYSGGDTALEVPDGTEITAGTDTPLNERLRIGTPFHDKILNLIRHRFLISHRALETKHAQWRKNEKQYYAHINVEAVDKSRQKKARPDAGYPGTAPIIVPMSMAIIDTILVYMLSVFFSSRPLVQLEGRGSEDVTPAEKMEVLLDYQLRSKYIRDMLLMYLWLKDSLIYNMGVIRTGWRKIESSKTVIIDPRKFGMPMEPYRDKQMVTEYEGNHSQLIDPYNFFPDPRVPLSRLSDGEFVGHLFEKSYNDLKRGEAQGIYFNLDDVPEGYQSVLNNSTGIIGLGGGSFSNSDRSIIHGTNNQVSNTALGFGAKDENARDFVELAEIEIDLIPREYGLADSSDPEKWIFAVANNGVIVRAEPLNNDHNQWSYSTIEYQTDGHNFLNKGVMETIAGLQEHVSWLLNSHMENVRAALNNEFVVDPDMIMMEDFENPGPGRVIRKKPAYYGVPVEGNGIYQLKHFDVTQSHIQNAGVFMDIAKLVTGANDNMQGQTNEGRKTATEIRTSNVLAAGKLKIFTQVVSEMGIIPWANILVSNTQQYLSESAYYRILGKKGQEGDPRATNQIMVGPQDIQGRFDFIPRDGSMPIDKFAQAGFWKEFLQVGMQAPGLAQIINPIKIIEQIAQTFGIKNFDEFIKPPQAQVTPDDLIAKMSQQGNAVPMTPQPRMSTDMENPRLPIGGESTIEAMLGGGIR